MDSESQFSMRSANALSVFELDLLPAAPAGHYRATLTSAGMTAEVDVRLRGTYFASFFMDIARDWRGWEGERGTEIDAIDSMGSAVRFTAWADGRGHVTYRCELARPALPERESRRFETHSGRGLHSAPGEWWAEALLMVEVANLDNLAALARSLETTAPTPLPPR